MNLTLIVVCAALLIGCAAPLTSATSGQAPVTLTNVTVADGDTLRATVGGARERIRIVGIDAAEVARDPSPAECWSTEAGVALGELLEGRPVLAFSVDDVDDRDRYDRLLRQVNVAGQDVAEYLLEQGHATSFRALENHQLSRYYLDLERAAEQRQRGLWGACDTARGNGPRGLTSKGTDG
ncbi:thermonuclease family protein [Knoellia locipacati]|uniref:thermonuclease family protein n=1 Tax=Knoellia locipacati TaxID=882824 RepID=UPI00384C46A5